MPCAASCLPACLLSGSALALVETAHRQLLAESVEGGYECGSEGYSLSYLVSVAARPSGGW